MLGIVVLLFFGALFRRRGNSWPKTIIKTTGVYVVYLVLLYGGLFAAVELHHALVAPPTDFLAREPSIGQPRSEPAPQIVRSTLTPSPASAESDLAYATLLPLPALTIQEKANQTGTTMIGPDGKAVQPQGPPNDPLRATGTRDGCDPAYPEERTCIPPGPPFAQGCAVTSARLFKVLPPDPQGLDHDGDGVGCEPIGGVSAAAPVISAPQPAPGGNCDSSYPDVCIPPVWVAGDLDCKDVFYARFRVVGSDPHRLDGPYDGSNPYEPDGVGCEWN